VETGEQMVLRYHVELQRECERGTCGHAGAPGVVWSQVMGARRPGGRGDTFHQMLRGLR
jgi:hypothetical protein